MSLTRFLVDFVKAIGQDVTHERAKYPKYDAPDTSDVHIKGEFKSPGKAPEDFVYGIISAFATFEVDNLVMKLACPALGKESDMKTRENRTTSKE